MTITALPSVPSRSDTPANFVTKADAFMAALPQFGAELNAMGTALNLATTSTSSSSVTIGAPSGTRTFTVPAGLGYTPGMALSMAYTTTPTNNMFGTVQSYSGTTLIVNITAVNGSGTYAAWSIALAAASSGAGFGANSFTGNQTLAPNAAFRTSTSTLASSATPDIWTGQSNEINYTGTVTATGFANAPQPGVSARLTCVAAASFTASANMLIDGYATGQTYTAAAGDTVEVLAVATTQFKLKPSRYDGRSIGQGQAANIASAATLVLNGIAGDYAHVTGSVGITAITLAQGVERTVVFDGNLTLTNSASLILPSASNINTIPGDVVTFRGEAGGVVRMCGGTINGKVLIASGSLSGASVTLSSIPANYTDLKLIIQQSSTATSAGTTQVQINADTTAANYTGSYMGATSVSAGTSASLLFSNTAPTIAQFCDVVLNIYEYANTGNFKLSTGLVNSAGAAGNAQWNICTWCNTAAVNSLTIKPSAGTWDAGTYALWGVR